MRLYMFMAATFIYGAVAQTIPHQKFHRFGDGIGPGPAPLELIPVGGGRTGVPGKSSSVRLFIRRWELAPGVSIETFASDGCRTTPSYVNDFERRSFTKLDISVDVLWRIHDETCRECGNNARFLTFPRLILVWTSYLGSGAAEQATVLEAMTERATGHHDCNAQYRIQRSGTER